MKPTKESYDDSCSRLSEIMKTLTLRKSKYYIQILAVSDITTIVAPLTHGWHSGYKSQKFIHESSYDGISGTDNDEQLSKNLSKCLPSLAARSVLLISELVNASCKRRALIMEDELENTYFC